MLYNVMPPSSLQDPVPGLSTGERGGRHLHAGAGPYGGRDQRGRLQVSSSSS